MKRLLFFICTLLCANVILAQSFDEGDLTYRITGAGEVEVYDCSSSVTSVNIPSSVTHTWKHYNFYCSCYITDSVRTYSVTSIRANAFTWCNSLTYVTIGNSVTSIGNYAFYDCSSLTYVTIPNSVTSIGEEAFAYCSSLTSVTIPNNVTSIGYSAFAFCDNLTTLYYNAINCSDCSYPFAGTPITTLLIGNGVQIIPNSFAPISLTEITIPNSVTSIGNDAFAYCSSLTSIDITNSVTSIGNGAFAYCSSLTSIDIPNSVTSIGGGAFAYCSSLTSVTLSNNITSLSAYYDNDNQGFFEGCSSLTSIDIPNSVTSIGNGAFEDCSSLTSITIPNSVTSIGAGVFHNCSSLTSVNIPNSVTYIGTYAFRNCPLTSVTCLATNPPALEVDAFLHIGYPSTLYVPNGCRQAYENANWTWLFDCIVELGSNNSITNLNIEVNNEEWGSVEVNEGCGTATLTAVVEEDCSEFLRWNDGDTNNPRVVNVTSDTSFTAIFKDPVLDTTINATIMQGETYNLNGQELSEEGVYNATVLSVAGCEINLTLNLDVIPNNYTNGETSSLQETELEEIVFYPNPTKGLISFSKTIERIEVVDISGKILLSFSNVREINIGDLPEGSYLLRLHSNENSVLRKIVKE